MSEEEIIDQNYIEEIRKNLEINEFNLKEECRLISNITQRYIEDLYMLKRKMFKTECYLKKVKGQLFEKWKNGEFEIRLTSTSDILIMIEKDVQYNKILSVFNELSLKVEFLEQVIKNFNNKGWNIQRIIDLEKINT
jgi:hypothetical protein